MVINITGVCKGGDLMNKLRVFRASRKLSGSDMAKVIGKTSVQYYKKENGKANFSDVEIRKVREAFNLSIEEVCELFGL
jgi:transcriptional regulator with XRE-family HTH domain